LLWQRIPHAAEWKAMDGVINFAMVLGLAVALLWLAHRALPDNS
jgi:hypothetical protein